MDIYIIYLYMQIMELVKKRNEILPFVSNMDEPREYHY